MECVFPGDIDGLSVYNIFSYIWFINVDVQITVFIVFSPGRILQNDVFIGDLFSGQLINLFVTVLETIVQFVFRIVFKPCSFRKYPGFTTFASVSPGSSTSSSTPQNA